VVRWGGGFCWERFFQSGNPFATAFLGLFTLPPPFFFFFRGGCRVNVGCSLLDFLSAVNTFPSFFCRFSSSRNYFFFFFGGGTPGWDSALSKLWVLPQNVFFRGLIWVFFLSSFSTLLEKTPPVGEPKKKNPPFGGVWDRFFPGCPFFFFFFLLYWFLFGGVGGAFFSPGGGFFSFLRKHNQSRVCDC